MKFNLEVEVPEELIENYKKFMEEENETNINFSLNNKNEIENLIKDMIEEQTSWNVVKIKLIEF